MLGRGEFQMRYLFMVVAGALVASPALGGGDTCSTATPTPVPVGSPGSPLTTTIFGDNSGATGPDGDCLLSNPNDLGWYEAFTIDTCARVTIDYCGSDPTRRPDWAYLYRDCCAPTIGFEATNRFFPCTDFNLWIDFGVLNPGTYIVPIYTVPGDMRCEDTGAPCVSSATCGSGFTCQDNLHPYQLNITAEEFVPALAMQASPVDESPMNEPEAVQVQGSVGPDAIVGHIFGCQQLGREGPIGSGTIGMSCATTACTIGDMGTEWYGLPDVNHPVISVNLFRLSTQGDGTDRLMQLGQSWVKHGFGTALDDECSLGCDPSEGHFNLNAPNCSDTYVGAQFVPCDLGPRSMINPYTGVMPASVFLGPSSDCFIVLRETDSYPANDHRDHDHNEISHRLQVKDVDLDPALNPGALYFAEGQYIIPHEWVDGNGTQNNNVSYRQVGVGGVIDCEGLLFDELSDTFSQQPAINAWPGASQSLIEPAPLVDGRSFLAYKVTDLGGGTWHYEYALYNMNMDRALGSLSIPIPFGATVSNAGFYAPLNHLPEPHTENYPNTPWSSSVSGGAITWSTDAHGVDPNANAVRWGTAYNFWFDSNRAPAATDATVGLFKTESSMTVPTLGPIAIPLDFGADPTGYDKNRAISLSAPSGLSVGSTAIRVRLVDLQNPNPGNPVCCPPADFSGFEGEDRWLGPPANYPEAAENPGGPQFTAALLRCTPHYRSDWDSFGLVHVLGAEIMPSSEYLVHAVEEGTGVVATSGLSISTPRWGDVVDEFCEPGNCPTTQPDFVDISAIVDKFKSVASAPIRPRAQLQPRVPATNLSVDFLDISSCVDAFKGLAFPHIWGPCSCPSSETCPALDACGRCSPEGP